MLEDYVSTKEHAKGLMHVISSKWRHLVAMRKDIITALTCGGVSIVCGRSGGPCPSGDLEVWAVVEVGPRLLLVVGTHNLLPSMVMDQERPRGLRLLTYLPPPQVLLVWGCLGWPDPFSGTLRRLVVPG